MDFAIVFKKVADFFIEFCGTEVLFNGYRFSVGSLFVFCALAGLLLWFLKGMAE